MRISIADAIKKYMIEGGEDNIFKDSDDNEMADALVSSMQILKMLSEASGIGIRRLIVAYSQAERNAFEKIKGKELLEDISEEDKQRRDENVRNRN